MYAVKKSWPDGGAAQIKRKKNSRSKYDIVIMVTVKYGQRHSLFNFD